MLHAVEQLLGAARAAPSVAPLPLLRLQPLAPRSTLRLLQSVAPAVAAVVAAGAAPRQWQWVLVKEYVALPQGICGPSAGQPTSKSRQDHGTKSYASTHELAHIRKTSKWDLRMKSDVIVSNRRPHNMLTRAQEAALSSGDPHHVKPLLLKASRRVCYLPRLSPLFHLHDILT